MMKLSIATLKHIKSICVAIAASAALAGCVAPVPASNITEVDNTNRFKIEYRRPRCGQMHHLEYTVQEFTYNGHRYLRFNGQDDRACVIVHDPDCPCHEKQQESEKPAYLDKWSWE